MKKLALLALLFFCSTTYAQFSSTILGGSDGSLAGAFAYPFWDGKAEAGLHVLGERNAAGDQQISAGPYFAMKYSIPGLKELVSEEHASTFAGVSLPYDFEQDNLIYTGFAGVVFLPTEPISPVLVTRYNWLNGANDTPLDSGFVFLGGLRITFK